MTPTQRRVDRFNRLYQVGTLMRYSASDGAPGVGRTASEATTFVDTEVVAFVFIAGCRERIPLSRVAPMSTDEIAEHEGEAQGSLGFE